MQQRPRAVFSDNDFPLIRKALICLLGTVNADSSVYFTAADTDVKAVAALIHRLGRIEDSK